MPHRKPTERPSRPYRLLPVAALLLLAPWAAECSWGGFALADQALVVGVLAPMYGGAAVLIRETARRTGGGWPAIVLLAGAFGVVQAGLVDQSLFNAEFLADTEFADARELAETAMVPVLGFSAQQALSFVGGHVLLSICAPIAVVESYVSADRRHRAWLGGPGLAVTGVLYLLGSALVFSDDSGRKGFLASPLQLTFAAVLALVLVTAALLFRRRSARRPMATPAPRPVWAALVVLPSYLAPNVVPGWLGVGVTVVVAVAAATAILAWSRRAGWGQWHILSTGSATLLVAAAGVYTVPNYAPASPTEALVGDVAVSVVALALVGGAFLRLRREPATPDPDAARLAAQHVAADPPPDRPAARSATNPAAEPRTDPVDFDSSVGPDR